MTAVAASQGADQLGNPPALTDGFSAAFVGAAAIAAVGAVVAGITVRTPRPRGAATAEPADAAAAGARRG